MIIQITFPIIAAYLSLMEKPEIGHLMEDTLDLESKRLVMEIKWRYWAQGPSE